MDGNAAHNRPIILIAMGVSASGKTTVARILADRLHCPFQEGDAFHPPANVEKMKSGVPLTDSDRLPWLQRIAQKIDEWRAQRQSGVLTCSALKRSYRDLIMGDRPEVRLVYLKGSRELIRRRIAARHGHFMPASLLDSQFATLEEPGPDERPITVDIDAKPEQIADEVLRQLAA
jgi:gluconokinase